ncbi:MAG: tRNA (N6-isopentenyl adenosine(37)-C2)-methylthiotransferase MiaB [Candidatus Omnitrophica bacterium]|nr:tRNA (N6-isopentenyl adenosine(37)-C2)-methylthiotransferase MiaB [Candidatus Omnitrophota bacterium]
MNERDSEEILAGLIARGYARVDLPETADLILMNTCSVREHAEDRVWGKLGQLRYLKEERPHTIFGLLGCMAQAHQAEIRKKLPHVDLVCGPGEIQRIPGYVEELRESRNGGPKLRTEFARDLDAPSGFDYRTHPFKAFVTIMEGCNKTCAYCLIPYTRGKERCRAPQSVLAEVRSLVQRGYKEITLLGQNVNSYGKFLEPKTDFADLLRQVAALDAPERIRFTTSHPWDAVPRMYEAMRDCPNICPHLHLPAQSGADTTLKRMRRGYTREKFLDQVQQLRATVPGLALTTDIIVGFPGETAEEFQETVSLMEEVRFDSAFVFKYSPRPHSPAAEVPDDVPQALKEDRNRILLDLQREISREIYLSRIGTIEEVLVEERSKKGQLFGRTPDHKNVAFDGPDDWMGQTLRVRIDDATPNTLIGSPVE